MGRKRFCVIVGFRLQDLENITAVGIRGREVDLAVSEYGFIGRMVRV